MDECVLLRLAERLSKKYGQEVLSVNMQESYFAESVIVFTGTEDKFVSTLDKYGVNGPILFDAEECEVCALTRKSFWLCLSVPASSERLEAQRGVVRATALERGIPKELANDIRDKILNNIDKISEKIVDNIRKRTGDNVQVIDGFIDVDDVIPAIKELMLVPQNVSDSELRKILSSHPFWHIMHKLRMLVSQKVRRAYIERRMKERKELIDKAVRECMEWFKEKNVKVNRDNFRICVMEKEIPLSWEDTRTAYSILREKLKQHKMK